MTDLTASYRPVADALQALSRCWCEERPPTREEGLALLVDAQIGLARLAVAAGVPPSAARTSG